MDDKMKTLLQTLETTAPPQGMKARVRNRLLQNAEVELNRAQRFVFANPLRAASLIAVTVSGLLWALLGSNYPVLLTSMFGMR